MRDQRIYYVPPRLAGSLKDWSGLENRRQKSWLVDHAADLGFNAIWFSPMCAASNVEKQVQGQTLSGSYYAIRDHFRFDRDLTTGNDAEDIRHMQHFCKQAAEQGIRVYADLPFNHAAADHPLVAQENAEVALLRPAIVEHIVEGSKLIGVRYQDGDQKKNYHFKFRRNADLSLLICGPADDPWSDVAQINYSSPEARHYFVDGDETHKGLFKQVIDWHLEQGIRGFRCDAAYLVPPETWQELITYARAREQDLVFMAETLGGPHDKVERLAKARTHSGTRPAFDLGMLGIYWWNFEDDGLPKHEHPRVLRMAHYGGAGSPDTHDTAFTLAGALRRAFNNAANKQTDTAIARASIRDYAVAVLACNSSYMQMGFEYSNEKQNNVFRGQVTPQDWKNLKEREGTVLDIREEIRIIHQIKESLQVGNCRAHFKENRTVQNGSLIKIHCEYTDVETGEKKADLILLLNKKPEHGAVKVTDPDLLALDDQGFTKFGARNQYITQATVWHTPIPQRPTPAAKSGYKMR